ncbi:hypothetical protein JTE90_021841 [Oedothorax gibbosus]|uniref:C2H2-type domain-containing protein n=1 Tax=Oedothorax gibbosus TaxID=931172 RepID=A0AAV6UYC0_9ARAC|nr:hypothetical protein JTE90_021841 [Oedothorax gibbosus]
MAQVLLDQKDNQLRLKRGLYEIAQQLLNSDIQSKDAAASVSNKLRRNNHLRKSNKKIIPKVIDIDPNLSSQGDDSSNFEDSESCDDPSAENSPSIDTSESTLVKGKGFSCVICEYVASSSQRLKEHQSRHTGIKPLECKVCGKKFAWRYSFQSHMASHKADNPNKCTICGKKYCNKSSVKNHMLRAHGKQELKNHVKIHYEEHKTQENLSENQEVIVDNCNQMIPQTNLPCSAAHIEAQAVFDDPHPTEEIMQSHIEITDNQALMYDCSLPNSMDKCADKCQLLQDSYVSQFLYPQQTQVQYASPSVPILNMYSTDPNSISQRSSCLNNMNSTNFSCMALNQNFGGFQYNIPGSDDLLSKCKLCRSLFHSTMVLRSHLIEYHRIEEENIEDLLT